MHSYGINAQLTEITRFIASLTLTGPATKVDELTG
jgi:hypothetical protein